jgi:hypothetical protein
MGNLWGIRMINETLRTKDEIGSSTDGFPLGKYVGSSPVSKEELDSDTYFKMNAPKAERVMPIITTWSPCGVPENMYRGNNK